MVLHEFQFKKDNSFNKRKTNCAALMAKYPDRIPIIIEKDAKCRNLNNIDKTKFLVPGELTLGHFLTVIRTRCNLTPYESIYTYCGKSLPRVSNNMYDIYREHKDEDGFLYITYCSENTFG